MKMFQIIHRRIIGRNILTLIHYPFNTVTQVCYVFHMSEDEMEVFWE